MKLFIRILLVKISLIVIIPHYLVAQNCFTEINENQVTFVEQSLTYPALDKNYNSNVPMIRLALHNIKKNDGTGGAEWAIIDQYISEVSDIFSIHNICFTIVYKDDINSDYYYSMQLFGGGDNRYWSLIENTNLMVNNAFNIFFVDNENVTGGRATSPIIGGGSNLPTITIGGKIGFNLSNLPTSMYFYPEILAHELGDCLGLYHTHHTVKDDFGTILKESILRPPNNDPNNILNNPGVNCNTYGDKLCDTLADPNLTNTLIPHYNEIECRYIGNITYQGYNYEPDERNIMSYASPNCMEHFTTGQVNRMRTFLLNGNDFDNYVIREDIIISGINDTDCYYGTENTIISTINHTSGNVTYEAANKVKLDSGFKITADANTSFHAKLGIYSCVEPLVTNYGKVTQVNNNTINGVKLLSSEKLNFSIFPNPASDYFTINIFTVNDQKVEIIMTDLTGKRILTKQKELIGKRNEQLEIDVSLLNQGIYFVTVKTTMHVKTQKLAIE